jgi:hypothetical protein
MANLRNVAEHARMKLFRLAAILATLASTPSSAWAACKAPPAPPSPPNGASATREQMLSAQTTIKGYNAAVVAFTECVRKDGGNETDINGVIAQLEKVAQQFNAELRAFKQRGGAQ